MEIGFSKRIKDGLLELLLLQFVCEEADYGYSISLKLKELANGEYYIPPASVYHHFNKMANAGLITVTKVMVGKKRYRVYYKATETGMHFLQIQKSLTRKLEHDIQLYLYGSTQNDISTRREAYGHQLKENGLGSDTV